MKKSSKDPLQALPGVGPAMAADFRLLGINAPEDLRDRNPRQLYDELCALTAQRHPGRLALPRQHHVIAGRHAVRPDHRAFGNQLRQS